MDELSNEIIRPSGEVKPEQKIEFEREESRSEAPENLQAPNETELIRKQLEREIDSMGEDMKKEAKDKVNTMNALGDAEKIQHLMQLVRDRGLLFSIRVAKDMNDPFILDTFHDTLAKDGYYKTYLK